MLIKYINSIELFNNKNHAEVSNITMNLDQLLFKKCIVRFSCNFKRLVLTDVFS
ncbi:hypothetical protein HYE21_00790 [Mycoplasmopsis bovis]|nr:hypothetical protein [Mycoplasmopsis bovis]QQH24284.1 hypothetical protein HYE21_00790 [Mycoplasmopsis bovis]